LTEEIDPESGRNKMFSCCRRPESIKLRRRAVIELKKYEIETSQMKAEIIRLQREHQRDQLELYKAHLELERQKELKKVATELEDARDELRRTKSEVESLKDGPGTHCVVCWDNRPEILFESCGHIIACQKCCRKLISCMACGARITKRRRVFLI
jgi:hypothetical protein